MNHAGLQALQSNQENQEKTRNILECYCVARKEPIRHEKTKLQVYIFATSSCVSVCAVTGLNTIKIPEIFQVFAIFPTAL